ncbi:MAG: DUF429 domain-containing protein [Solirubrobacteraceae bacterium]
MASTLGIDLASQPESTAVCAIQWDPSPRVTALWRGVHGDGVTKLHDELLLSAMRGDFQDDIEKIGVDAPFGWPQAFVAAIQDPDAWPVEIDHDRSRLERRDTDRWVREQTGKQPLSVSTDRIAYPAMRLAGLLSAYRLATRTEVDRTGRTGMFCEVYPDPAIRRFGLWSADAPPRESYKGPRGRDRRSSVVDLLTTKAPWLEIDESHVGACRDHDDCLDAVLCALVARAAAVGLTQAIPDRYVASAAVEGWIHLPVADALPGLRPQDPTVTPRRRDSR